ncbi:MAG: ASCH domain-containing protein [Anaeromicrobium sp.]|jgi:uncharacterized protein YhfF|uniref:ASCH domain-containing protein n=1 Tax=Anaeromicrobium sp. TaxID=1929132 RepID=UPI0025D09705|nr:ASCH domain-containing protein [Anaeromicrobium sp.]MCT4595762.1 ASCH domain-containing protein [Anaeromicrobium sp.]
MIKEHNSVEEMWKGYLKSIGEHIENTDKSYISWYFCDNEKSANELAQLVKDKVKRATTSLYYWYEVENEPLPKEGDLNVITNWDGIAECIIQTKKVTIVPFDEVTEEFAKTEGEGDKSLKYWREAHIDAFTRGLKEQGKEFSEDMLVVCEEFELVYK